MIIYYYTIVIQDDNKEVITNKTQRELILNNVNHIVNEKDLIINCNYDYNLIYIFDLNKIPNHENQYELQINPTNKLDIINANYLAMFTNT